MMSYPSHEPGTENDVVGRRIAATVIDTIVVYTVYYVGLLGLSGLLSPATVDVLSFLNYFIWFVVSVFGFSGLLSLHGGSWVWFLTGVLTWAGYATVCEAVRGQTVGKLLTGLVVIQGNESRCTLRAAAIRNGLRIVDGLFYYFVGLLVIGFSSDSQRIGDWVADTRVLRVRQDKLPEEDISNQTP